MTRARSRPMPPSILLALSGWVALAATRLPGGSAIRAVPVTLFLLLAPGTAVVRRWMEVDALEKVVIAVAVSTAAAALIGEALVLTGSWSSTRALALLAALTTGTELAGPLFHKARSRERLKGIPK
jgi:uncharacterized membrane protein